MEGYIMSVDDFIDYIIDKYSLEDVLYILGKDERWLLRRIKEELLDNRDAFVSGDDYYMRID